jgi:hypothetical protein
MSKGVFKGKAWKTKIVLMYLQSDGYPSGNPLDMAKWLSKGKLVNGLGFDQPEIVFNGAACLAAQLVSRFKDGPGGCYLHPVNERGSCGEDYVYDIIVDEEAETIDFVAYDVNGGYNGKPQRFRKLYSGTPAGFVEWVESKEKKQE